MDATVASGPHTISTRIEGEPRDGCAVLVHANGFCKETWLGVTAALDGIQTMAPDVRGHGASSPIEPPVDWWDLGSDMLAVTTESGPTRPRLGVGHSMGGALLAIAEILTPGTFDALVLVEPILLPPPFRRVDDHPLTLGALRRRRSFASSDEVVRQFRGRGPFARWQEPILLAYAEHGTVADGYGGRTLACTPETEAELYKGAPAHGAWDRLNEITCPVTVVIGEHSDSHSPEFGADLTDRFQQANLVIVPEATHFVPMEKPEAVAEAVRVACGE